MATRVVKSYTHCCLLAVMLGRMSRVPTTDVCRNRILRERKGVREPLQVQCENLKANTARFIDSPLHDLEQVLKGPGSKAYIPCTEVEANCYQRIHEAGRQIIVPGMETLINGLAVAVIRSRFPTAPRRLGLTSKVWFGRWSVYNCQGLPRPARLSLVGE